MNESQEVPRPIAYKAAEVARMLGVHRSTVTHWCAQGAIRSTKLGRCVLIPASEVDRIANGGAE